MAHDQSGLHASDKTDWNAWRGKLLVVLLVAMAWLLVRAIFFEGFHGSDDFAHLRFAHFWDHYPRNHWEPD